VTALDKQTELASNLRDAVKIITDSANAYLEFTVDGDKKSQGETKPELAFTILRFEPLQGAKLGEYEVAYKTNNSLDKWSSAYDILRACNATIKNRFHGEGYQYCYWLYVEDKIYRQKLKPKDR
jgi:hypothetical protein